MTDSRPLPNRSNPVCVCGFYLLQHPGLVGACNRFTEMDIDDADEET